MQSDPFPNKGCDGTRTLDKTDPEKAEFGRMATKLQDGRVPGAPDAGSSRMVASLDRKRLGALWPE